jgi:mRNA interferase RelE/StbE
MSYKLEFDKRALKEWHSLDNSIKYQFKKKLQECLKNPNIVANKLNRFDNLYKIKLRSIGYRLVYEVVNDKLVIIVIAIGKRDKNKIYNLLDKRIF